jgi:hypothetical protein
MVHFEEFIASGRFGSIDGASSCEQIIQSFGEPDVFEPARKSYPTFLVYGDLEFCLRQNRLRVATLSLKYSKPDLPSTVIFKRSFRAS